MRYENEIVGKDAKTAKPPEEKAVKPEKNSMTRNALLLIRDIAIAFVIIIVILQFIKPTIVFEHSMEDTLHPDDYVFLDKQAYRFGDINYGDIIVFSSNLPDDHGLPKNLIKRVIGKPGDTIEVKDDAVYRNGVRLVEPYTKDGTTLGQMNLITIPADEYFAMGDNRQVSKDSRSPDVGCVPRDKIEGKVIFRLFPISSAGSVY